MREQDSKPGAEAAGTGRARALLVAMGPPMLATLSDESAVFSETSCFEVKYDGYRALSALWRGELALCSRNGNDLSERFAETARAIRALPLREAVLDGELVALDAEGRPRFQLLGRPVEHRYVVFDLLFLDGRDLRALPLAERRSLLERALRHVHGPVELAERLPGDVHLAMALARARGLEGIIAKRIDAPYVGRRSEDWLKLKAHAEQELAVVGFTPHARVRGQVGALLVATHGKDGFAFAGKVGTGFSDDLRALLWSRLSPTQVSRPPLHGPPPPTVKDAHWVKPSLVAQVRFTEWTLDGRLRHPSFVGLREDKAPEACVRERPRSKRRQHARPAAAALRRTRGAPPVEVALTHPDRVVYPEPGYTKADVFAYMRDVSQVLVETLRDRPLALQQWPLGLAAPGYFRQDVPHAPPWLRVEEVKHAQRVRRHLIVDRPETVLWLANQSALTLHMWSSRVSHLDRPDWLVFDLDPGSGPFEDTVTLAIALRRLLEELGLEGLPKTSGKRGLHVLVPFRRGPSHDDATAFARTAMDALGQQFPKLATTRRRKSERGGRLYLDALQNGWGKTVVAPYSLRDTPEATVSTPLSWDEVDRKLDPRRFTLKSLPRRLERVGDLFAPALRPRQALPRLQ